MPLQLAFLSSVFWVNEIAYFMPTFSFVFFKVYMKIKKSHSFQDSDIIGTQIFCYCSEFNLSRKLTS